MAFSSGQANSLNGNGLDFFSVSLCSIELSKVEPLWSVPSRFVLTFISVPGAPV
jgi:hypothetical protein